MTSMGWRGLRRAQDAMTGRKEIERDKKVTQTIDEKKRDSVEMGLRVLKRVRKK